MEETVAHQFRRSMRALTSAVSVISTAHQGRMFGMTATAVTSVSMEPPSLLVCINKSATVHDALLGCRRFYVNLLHAQQSNVASAFSSKPVETRFANGEWTTDAVGIPFLVGAQANVLCDVDDTHSYGSHTIVIGKARAVAVRDHVKSASI